MRRAIMASEPQFMSTRGRRADRRSMAATVQFRAGTRRANVQIRDISRFGARIGGVFLVHGDDRFYVKLPGLEAIEARVAWVEEFEFGCEFVRPLSEVVFEAITRSL